MLNFIARLLGAIRICSDRPGSGDPLAIEEDYYRFQRAAQSREFGATPSAAGPPRAPDSARVVARPAAPRWHLPRIRRPVA
jgi:hypothetical protein